MSFLRAKWTPRRQESLSCLVSTREPQIQEAVEEITRGQGLKVVKAKQVSPGREPPTGGDDHGQLSVQDGSSGGMIWVCDMHWGDIGT